jgi:hypothetical protein
MCCRTNVFKFSRASVINIYSTSIVRPLNTGGDLFEGSGLVRQTALQSFWDN